VLARSVGRATRIRAVSWTRSCPGISLVQHHLSAPSVDASRAERDRDVRVDLRQVFFPIRLIQMTSSGPPYLGYKKNKKKKKTKTSPEPSGALRGRSSSRPPPIC